MAPVIRCRLKLKEIFTFLDVLEQFPIVWNIKLKEYLNKSKREDQTKKLLEELARRNVNMGEEEFRVRFKSIKDTYRKELRKVTYSMRSGEPPYTPRLAWYDRADSFLRDVVYNRLFSLETQDEQQQKIIAVCSLAGTDPEIFEHQGSQWVPVLTTGPQPHTSEDEALESEDKEPLGVWDGSCISRGQQGCGKKIIKNKNRRKKRGKASDAQRKRRLKEKEISASQREELAKTSAEAAAYLPSFKSIEKSVYKSRITARQQLPKKIDDVSSSEQCAKTNDGKDVLNFDDEDDSEEPDRKLKVRNALIRQDLHSPGPSYESRSPGKSTENNSNDYVDLDNTIVIKSEPLDDSPEIPIIVRKCNLDIPHGCGTLSPPGTPIASITPTPCKIVQTTTQAELSQGDISTPTSEPSFKKPKTEDRFDVFGKNVAYKLREMDKTQRILAEKIINDALFEGEMGVLTRYHKLVDESKAGFHPEVPSQADLPHTTEHCISQNSSKSASPSSVSIPGGCMSPCQHIYNS